MCLLLSMGARTIFVFRRLGFPDGAFALFMCIGTGFYFLAAWFVCALAGIDFNLKTVLFCILIITVISVTVRKRGGNIRGKSRNDIKAERKRFLIGFLVFTLLFLVAVYIKGYKPILDNQTEQYMDYGFMNCIYRQQKLPFEDMWFAGSTVNYYYLGQAVAVFMCRLALTTPEYGYNLFLCTVFSALALAVFEFIYGFLNSMGGMRRCFSCMGGVVASLTLTCGGNGHWIIYGIFRQLYNRISGIEPPKNYWFADSTAFIGYNPDIADKGRHEFPSYTLLLGDVHAHVCNMLFTIPFLAVLIDYALDDADRSRSILRRLFSGHIIVFGLLLGLFKGVNYWDYPIYYVVAGAVILFCDLKKYGSSVRTFIIVLLKGLVIYLLSCFVMIPFNINYMSPVDGVYLCDRHSPVYKLIIIWFPHLITAALLLKYLFTRMIRKKGEASDILQMLVVIAITLCGLGLLLLPELVYVKDIYGDEFERYNTMFKLTYQGYILLSLCMGIAVAFFFNEGYDEIRFKRGRSLRVSGYIVCVLSMMLAGYMIWSTKAWFGNIWDISARKGISATAFIREDPSYDDAEEAIDILLGDKRRKIHIIEEAGNSYSPENRLSVFSGTTTVGGWFVHEWVWRNDSDVVRNRHDEVREFYSCGYEDYCREIVKRYEIDYIYVGRNVCEKYSVDYSGFEDLGEHVWESDDGNYMLIKVQDGLL